MFGVRILVSMALLVLTSIGASSTASAAEWTCHNPVEISCGNAVCAVQAKDFTAKDITLAASGQVSICAYSGCWVGRAKVTGHAGQLLFAAHKLKFSTGTASASMAAIIDTSDGIGLIKIAGFAEPLVCSQRK